MSKKSSELSAEEVVQFWLKQIAASEKREKVWLGKAEKITAIYEGEKREDSPFNILYSNTDTLMPALYSSTPRTQAVRRFKDADPLGMAAATAITRIVDYHLDTNEEDYPEFDQLAEQAILEALVPGRGVIRWKYDATIKEATKVEAAKTVGDATNNVQSEGGNIQSEAVYIPGSVSGERVCGEYVPYDRFLMGYARKWKDVPWIAYLHDMTEDEVETNFGEKVADKTTFAVGEVEGKGEKGEDEQDNRKLARVYEIWNKSTREVLFVSASCKSMVMKQVADPLTLRGFYPQDEPLAFQRKISTMIPTPPYLMYAEQAEELNLVTRRITAIVAMIKVRGMYDQTVEGIEEVLKGEDGFMVAAKNVSSMQQGQKLENALWLMPLEPLVGVLNQLLQHRQAIKQVIYEITGISDILRGSTVASETATAQSIKNKWGTLRLKSMQGIVQKWSRNNLRIIGEIAGKKFSVETFQKITGLPYLRQEEMQKLQMGFEQKKQEAMMTAQQTGQPPQQPPQQVLDALATPVWESVVQLLKDPELRSFRLDIETNSTIAEDLQEDQKHIGELLNALSQYLNGVTPLIESGTMPFEAAKSMMMAIVRRMSFGPEVERQIEEMKAPPPKAPETPPPPPVDPNIQLKAEAEKAKLQLEMQKLQQEMEFAKQEHELKLLESRQKMALAEHVHTLKLEAAVVKSDAIKQQAQAKAAQPATSGSGD